MVHCSGSAVSILLVLLSGGAVLWDCLGAEQAFASPVFTWGLFFDSLNSLNIT